VPPFEIMPFTAPPPPPPILRSIEPLVLPVVVLGVTLATSRPTTRTGFSAFIIVTMQAYTYYEAKAPVVGPRT